MIGFLIWKTGSGSHPVAFVYAREREEAKQLLREYLRQESVTRFYNPDNWTVEPVTPPIATIEQRLVLCPNVNLL